MTGFGREAWCVNAELRAKPSIAEVSSVGVEWGLLYVLLNIRPTASMRGMSFSS